MISRGDRYEHVYRQLRDRIVRGDLPPGARLVEQEVAEQLQVGRTPVREALQVLLQEQFLVASSGARRLLSVSPLRVEDGRELFGLLGELEASALRRLSDLTAGDRELLSRAARAANRQFQKVVSRAPIDPEAAFDSHKAFHATLTAPLAGDRLRWLLGLIRPQVERYEWYCGPALEGSLDIAVAEHEVVIRAIEEGTAEEAAQALAQNWHNAASRLAAAIQAAESTTPFTLR